MKLIKSSTIIGNLKIDIKKTSTKASYAASHFRFGI